MRQIVLDTETTGLETRDGHRIIEIGCLEMERRRPTGNNLHIYLNPERDIDQGALDVHGITQEFLADKPVFASIVDDLMAYLDGAELIIHNAAFDVNFLNYELKRLGRTDTIEQHCTIIDTLPLARQLHPGQKNSLDALCRRYGVDNSKRDLHGALLDAELLADVYLLMTGGQTRLFQAEGGQQETRSQAETRRPAKRLAPLVVAASAEEAQQHLQYLEKLASGGASVAWLGSAEGQGAH
jgi:DNA polymerase-3 subunit epsilon